MDEKTAEFRNLFEIDQLRCFVAAAEQHSFKQAATILHISQPLVSQQIAELERQTGKTLFVRGHQGAEMTLEGTVLLEKAREILARVSGMASSVQTAQLNVRVSGKLRIAIEQLFDHSVAAQSVFRFRTQNPEADIDLQILRMPDIIRELLNGTIDIGMCVLPLGELDAQLEYRVLARERLCFVASSLLLPPEREDRFSLVADCLPCCLLERDYRGTNAAVQICMALNISPQFLFFNDIESILLQVESGTGFTILPEKIASAFSLENMAVVPLTEYDVSRLLLAALWRPKEAAPLTEQYLQFLFADCPPEIAGLRQELLPKKGGAKKTKTMVIL